jgi:two-component system chemotaxis response regulator CheB
VVIGSSTGGPQALTTVLKRLPGDFPVPIVVVQHMPPVFTYHLAQRLNQECELNVCEATAGEVLEPGHVYIAPGDHHLEVIRKGTEVYTALQQAPPENSCRPAVDVLFRTAAAAYGSGCLAVVLTGMGQDGKRGAEHVASTGGRILVQDAATSVVWGMPRAVAEAGLADSVLPLGSIADAITRAAQVGRRVVINS